VTADRFRTKGSRGSDPRLLRPNNGPATRPHIGERPRASRIVQALGLDQPSTNTITQQDRQLKPSGKTLRSREAKEAITDHEEAQRALLGNLERLRKSALGKTMSTATVELNGPTMMARIGFMRALNRNVERTFNSSRKDTHWGRRKLKRDQ
jgi:hypothetical protein